MRFLLAAVGKLKDDEERGIVERYVRRLNAAGKPLGLGPVAVVELPESRAASAAERKADEAKRLLKAADGALYRIALDEKGKLFSSETFAALLGRAADSSVKSCAFLIGGPDGHDPELLKACNVTLSLGSMTLPHGLARVVLTEQLYRAATILAGHPYHRA